MLTEAVEVGRDAVARWPQDAQLRRWLGMVYFKVGQNALALQTLQSAEKLDSAHFDEEREFGKSVDCLLTGKAHVEPRKRVAKDPAGLG
jgi:protein involved in temperature-dependent protein secretion